MSGNKYFFLFTSLFLSMFLLASEAMSADDEKFCYRNDMAYSPGAVIIENQGGEDEESDLEDIDMYLCSTVYGNSLEPEFYWVKIMEEGNREGDARIFSL